MKKIISLILMLLIILPLFVSCGSFDKNDGKIKIVTTVFPEYDWVKNIVSESENVNVTMLLDKGVDLHSFQPSADDIIKISNCDLFIYIGGESDKWVDDALNEATNKNMKVINLMDVLGESLKEEETVEGMQAESEEHEEKEAEYDEHIWLSLKNAVKLINSISNEICKLDSENASKYIENTKNYIEKITNLDEKYNNEISVSKRKVILFADRFPFRYLADDYNLKYYAAFSGCSAESEASFETVRFLAEKVDELNLPAVLILEGSDGKIANTVINSSISKNAKILSLDSMQSVSSNDAKNGTSYLSIMEKNFEVIKEVLN